jgi:hypothetical protein
LIVNKTKVFDAFVKHGLISILPPYRYPYMYFSGNFFVFWTGSSVLVHAEVCFQFQATMEAHALALLLQ